MSTQPDDDTDEQDGDTGLDDQTARNLVVGLAIAVEGALIGVAWVIGFLLEVPALSRFEFDWAGVAWGLVAALPMLAALFVVVRYPVGPLRSIKRFTDEIIRPLMASCSLLDLVGISILAGFGEELLFRGVLQEAFQGGLEGALGERYGMLAAVVLVALLFGLLHAVTPSYAVLAALMGVYLGLVFHFTGNLLSVVVAHAVYDFLALVYVTRGPGSAVVAPQQEEDGEDAAGQG